MRFSSISWQLGLPSQQQLSLAAPLEGAACLNLTKGELYLKSSTISLNKEAIVLTPYAPSSHQQAAVRRRSHGYAIDKGLKAVFEGNEEEYQVYSAFRKRKKKSLEHEEGRHI